MRSTDTASVWIPSTYDELNALLRTHPIHEGYVRAVVQPAPGVMIKYKGDFAEEVRATLYARRHFSFPIPRILHHPPLRRGSTSSRSRKTLGRPTGVWYICTEQCPGVSLDKVIDNMTPSELNHIAEQIRKVLTEMGTLRPKTLGSVTGGPYRNGFFPTHVLPAHAFTSLSEFIDLYRYILPHFCTESFTESILSQLPRNAPIRFAHAELLPRNIIVSGTTITGIIDWATAGFWPGYWEYCRMHDPRFSSPGWDQVLKLVFFGERRQAEINAVYGLITMVDRFFYC